MSTTARAESSTRHAARFLALAAALTVVASPAMTAETRPAMTAAEFGHALACGDEDSVKASLYGLHARLDAMVQAGQATRAAMTKMRDGKRPVLDYQPVGLFTLLDRQPLAINRAYGMLPALTAIFDEPLDALIRFYEHTGFEFRCQALGSDGDRSCEAQRPSANGRLVVALLEGPTALPAGRVLVACTLITGNPFR